MLDGTTTLDQAPPKPLLVVQGVTQQKYEEEYVLELADRVIGQSLEEGNFDVLHHSPDIPNWDGGGRGMISLLTVFH